jgi:hypothetical protein
MQARLVTLTKMEWHSQLRSKKFSKKGKMKKVFNVIAEGLVQGKVVWVMDGWYY